MDWKKWDSVFLGIAAGLLATKPEISIWIQTNLAKIIPASAFLFGAWSIPLYGMIIGGILGYIAEKT